MPDTQTQTAWDRGSINRLLLRNPKAVEKALILLHDRQTTDEQQTGQTSHANKRGFGAFDAEIFSSFAMQIKRGRWLSPKQIAVCLKLDKHGNPRIGRYWAQLAELIPTDAKPPAPDLGGAVFVPVHRVPSAIEQVPKLEGAFADGAW